MSFSTEENKKQYNGNDATTVFSFPYPYQAKTDLTVILSDADDNDTTLVLDTHYSLTDPGANGSVTYPISGDPLATGEVLTIVREMEFNQETDLGNHGAYFLQELENALDKCTMQLQQVKEIVDRSVKMDITDTDSPPSVTEFNAALATVQALEAAFDNLVVQNHSAVATGSQTAFTMPAIWPDLDATSNVSVYDDGLKIDRDDYSVTGDDEITFDTGRTVGHTIIFELHEALSSDDLDSAISARSDYNVIIDINGDYPSVAAYIADSPQAGDRVLIRVNENLSSELIIPDDLELKRIPGTKFSVNSVGTPVIRFGDRVKTTGEFRLETNHTSGLIDKAFLLNGDDNHHENLILDINNAGSVTHAFHLPVKKGNYVQGRTIITGAGGISSELTDNSSNDLNDVIIINDSKIYRSSGAQKFEFINQTKGADVASAATLPLIRDGNYNDVTGSVTITAFASVGIGSFKTLHFDAALILTHHATDLVLPGGSDITTQAGDEFTFFEYASGDWRLISSNKVNGVIQVENAQISAVATGTTVMPFDDTIPQNTEGDQYLNQTITPKDANNILIIEAKLMVAHSVSSVEMSIALFQDAIANALCAISQHLTGVNDHAEISLRYVVAADSTSLREYKIRAGGNSAGTTTVNGITGTRRFGGITISSLTITEVRN